MKPVANEESSFSMPMDLRAARKLIEAGRAEDAVTSLMSVPRSLYDPEFLFVYTEAAQKTGRWIEAYLAWRKLAAHHSDPRAPEYWLNALRALVSGNYLEKAEIRCRRAFVICRDREDFQRLYFELAIRLNHWGKAVERWQRLNDMASEKNEVIPVKWIHVIGLSNALRQHQDIENASNQSLSALSLSLAIEPDDCVQAMRYARAARKFHQEKAIRCAIRLLNKREKKDASLWWLRQLAISQNKRRSFPQYIEALMKASRFQEARDAVGAYETQHGRDLLFFRFYSEHHFRIGGCTGLRQFLESHFYEQPVKGPKLSPLKWLVEEIHYHPDPQSLFDTATIKGVLKFAKKFDTPASLKHLEQLLWRTTPVRSFDDKNDLNALSSAIEGYILQRKWGSAEALCREVNFLRVDTRNLEACWKLLRLKIDFLMAEKQIGRAHDELIGFLDRMMSNDQQKSVIANFYPMLCRFPNSTELLETIQKAADIFEYTKLASRAAIWKEYYGGRDDFGSFTAPEKNRCYIVGNSPSIAKLPLAELAGETIFSVNRGGRAVELGLPNPDYLVVSDDRVYLSHQSEIDATGAISKGYYVSANCLWNAKQGLFPSTFGLAGFKYSTRPLKFSPGHFHRAESVVLVAAQIALTMGFKEIIFIGVDLDYDGAASYFYTDSHQDAQRLSNFRQGGIGSQLVNAAFSRLNKYALQAYGAKFYNASPVGRLNSIPRIKFMNFERKWYHSIKWWKVS